eukprot:SAG11_NODE_57_length_19200_cov_18.288417_18_plen_228_part_00
MASVSAAALSLHLFKQCSSECSSVPVWRRPRRIGLETCANTLSGDLSFGILENSPAQRVFQPVPVFPAGVRADGERRWWALRAATRGFEPHGRWESIGATAEAWGGPSGPAPAASTVGCSSVPIRSKLFQCARIGFGGKEAALGPGSSTNRRAVNRISRRLRRTDRQSPAGRPAGSSLGRGLANSLVSTEVLTSECARPRPGGLYRAADVGSSMGTVPIDDPTSAAL